MSAMMDAREAKVPKFKRCKISRQQLVVLMQHFGDSAAPPPPPLPAPPTRLRGFPARGRASRLREEPAPLSGAPPGAQMATHCPASTSARPSRSNSA